MDVNTGAILAMVTANGYDLNNPYQLSDEEQKKIDALPENEQDAAESAALSAMWRNKVVADTYEPGSVFKMCTASMVLEEGLVNEMISKIQTMRKDANFEVMDHIRVGLLNNEKIASLFEKNQIAICEKVLADEFASNKEFKEAKEWNINGETVTISVEKV